MPCACRAGCSTRQCSCRKNGHDCTLACQCLECTNRRPKDPARQRDAELATAAPPSSPAASGPYDTGTLSQLQRQTLAQETIRRMTHEYDTEGRLRQTSVEVIERKTAAAERISQHLSPRLLERLSALPEIQARQQNGEEPGQAIVATLLGAWANAVATGQVHGFYRPEAIFEAHIAGANGMVDRLEGAAAIGQYLGLYGNCHWEFAGLRENTDEQYLVIECQGICTFTALPPDNTQPVLSNVCATLGRAGVASVHFARFLRCMHADDPNNQLLPILRDEIHFQLGTLTVGAVAHAAQQQLLLPAPQA